MDLSNFTNLSGMGELAVATNNAVDGILFSGGLFVFFVIILMVSLRNGELFENVFPMASWIMFVVSLFFWFARLVPTGVALIFLACAAVGTFLLYVRR